MKVLTGIFHHRIKYPDDLESEAERKKLVEVIINNRQRQVKIEKELESLEPAWRKSFGAHEKEGAEVGVTLVGKRRSSS